SRLSWIILSFVFGCSGRFLSRWSQFLCFRFVLCACFRPGGGDSGRICHLLLCLGLPNILGNLLCQFAICPVFCCLLRGFQRSSDLSFIPCMRETCTDAATASLSRILF
ncbi:unnamed protein product, partial [Phaeothamnion confervicola]